MDHVDLGPGRPSVRWADAGAITQSGSSIAEKRHVKPRDLVMVAS
jgi:hypothetical protein